jgi:acetylglutamate kinase
LRERPRHSKFRAVPPEPSLPSPADAVLRFLESLGRRSETEFYVRLFRQLPKQSFAIIAPGAPVLRQATGAFVEQLRFLADLGLFTPIVLGLFDPATSASSAERLARRLPGAGLDPCVHDASEASLVERLSDELRRERVPIVHFRALENQSTDERFKELAALAAGLGTRKLVLLRRRGALAAQGDKPIDLGALHVSSSRSGISLVNLRTDRDLLLASRRLRKEDATLLEHVQRLLSVPEVSNMLVSVASPFSLLKELFTLKGAGTLIKSGSPIERLSSYADLDVARLSALLEASFERALDPLFFERPPLAVYLESSYRGAAILHESSVAPFLTKFAVEPEAQGEGIGQDLWQAMLREHRALYWRARHDNPINGWYVSLCDGMVRGPMWHVFWRGVEPSRVPDVVSEALSRPADFGLPLSGERAG